MKNGKRVLIPLVSVFLLTLNWPNNITVSHAQSLDELH